MKATITIDKDTPPDEVPDVLRHAVINTVAFEIFSSAVANAVVNDLNSANTQEIFVDLLRFYFMSNPNNVVTVDIDIQAGTKARSENLTQHALRAPHKTLTLPSESTAGLMYSVVLEGGRAISCTCPNYTKGGKFCKHMFRAEQMG